MTGCPNNETAGEEKQGMTSGSNHEPQGEVHKVPLNIPNTGAISSQNEDVKIRYSTRAREKTSFPDYGDKNSVRENNNVSFTSDYCYNLSNVPITYKHAISSPDSFKWQMAMKNEL